MGWKLGDLLSFPGGSAFFLSLKTSPWPLECFPAGYFRDFGGQVEAIISRTVFPSGLGVTGESTSLRMA